MPGEPKLVDDEVLAGSAVVANRAMNRERRLAGRDGYSRLLGLDLCCGSGRALFDAAELLPEVEITGMDLVGYFGGPPRGRLTFQTASIATWEPAHAYDLITCVHGLHYVGDKLGTLTRVASWLTPDGVFAASFDVADVRLADGSPASRRLSTALRGAGFTYAGRNRRIGRTGHATASLPFRYLGADEQAGPNYTGQPAVHSYYDG